MERVVILGATGQLGSDLVQAFGVSKRHEVVAFGHDEVECIKSQSVRAALLPIRPHVVINCAAFVRVDDCEDMPERAFEVNALGALYVARVCAEAQAFCVFVSTDYVFDGSKADAYVESDVPRPVNVYGTSKLAGEQLVQQAAPRSLIVRTASLFGKTGARGKGGNFVETILSKVKNKEILQVVNDLRMSPTYTRDAAEALIHALQSGATGVLHLANDGDCSWYEFAKKTLELVGLNAEIEPITSIAHPTKARRPKNSALRSEKLASGLNYPLRPWEKALEAYLFEKGYIGAAV